MKLVVALFFLVISVITFFITIVLLLLGSGTLSMPEYYADQDNYVELEVTIKSIYEPSSNNDNLQFFLDLGDDTQFVEDYFKIIPSNERIVENNGFYDDIQEGDTITIISAPRYFGDGYHVPIVALKTDTKEYLDFDTGYMNQVESSEDSRAFTTKWLITSTSTSLISLGLFIYLGILNKSKQTIRTEI